MRKKSIAISASLIMSCLLAASAVSNAFALYTKGANNASFNIGEATKHTVMVYSDYSTSWTGTPLMVSDGSKILNVTDPSVSGYTFEGWVKDIAPSSTNYTATYSTLELNNLVCNEDMSFYPIFKSNDKKVYTNSNSNHYYYDIDTDVEIGYKLLKQTLYGYRYLGFHGIPNAESSWNADRDLYTNSGIYKFFDVDGGLNIKRKVGALFADGSYWNTDEWGHYKINLFANNVSPLHVEELYRKKDDTKGKIMSFYTDYSITDIQFLRMNDTYSTQWNYSAKTSLSSYSSTNWIIDNSSATGWDNWQGTWRAKGSSTYATSNWGFEGSWDQGYTYHL